MTVDGGGSNARVVRKRLITSKKSANHADRKLIGRKKLKGTINTGESIRETVEEGEHGRSLYLYAGETE